LVLLALYLIPKVFGAGYASECRDVVTRQSPEGQTFRLNFREVEHGQTYPRGEPSRTTGYYTRYTVSFGDGGQEMVTCYAALDGKFSHAARVAKGFEGFGPICFYADNGSNTCP
jgi:hypothetical protein